jgi:hypothetical protein
VRIPRLEARPNHLGISRRHDVMMHVDQRHAESLARQVRRAIAWRGGEKAR